MLDETARAERVSRAARRLRLGVIVGGALLMGIAGALTGAAMRVDDLALPTLRGPRLRTSSAAPVAPPAIGVLPAFRAPSL